MPDHPDVGESLRTCAAILRTTGRDIEAETMEERARSIDRRHGMDRPDPMVSD